MWRIRPRMPLPIPTAHRRGRHALIASTYPPPLQRMKRRVETIVAELTDHLAIVMRIEFIDPVLTRGQWFWCVYTTLLRETDFRLLLQYSGNIGGNIRNTVCKTMLRNLFTWEGTDRRRDRGAMVNFYYEVINTTLCAQSDNETTTISLKRLKVKITQFHHEEQRRLFINTGEHDRLDDERPTLLKARRYTTSSEPGNCMYRGWYRLKDRDGGVDTTAGILRALKEYMLMKFDVIATKVEYSSNGTRSKENTSYGSGDGPWHSDCNGLITRLRKRGKPNKAPGDECVSLEFLWSCGARSNTCYSKW
jgi:hypothetical protein